MICRACRSGEHWACADLPRAVAEQDDPPPGTTPGTGRWCFCQHQPREEPRP